MDITLVDYIFSGFRNAQKFRKLCFDFNLPKQVDLEFNSPLSYAHNLLDLDLLCLP